MNVQAHGAVKEVRLEAVVIRADGRREDLGVIARYREPFWKRWLRAFAALFAAKQSPSPALPEPKDEGKAQ